MGDSYEFSSHVQTKQLIPLRGAGNQALFVLCEDYLHSLLFTEERVDIVTAEKISLTFPP